MTTTLDSSGLHSVLRDEVRFFIETREAELTRYGLYDSFMRASDLDVLFRPSADVVEGFGDRVGQAVREAIADLVTEGTLLRFDDGPVDEWRFRSRMAEIVRLTVALRQRFNFQRTFTESRSLVQDVHYEVRERRYPDRHLPASDLFDVMLKGGALDGASHDEARFVFKALSAALAPPDRDVRYSGFQMRAFAQLAEWLIDPAHQGEPRGMVVSAGTGAGKTNTFFVPALAYAVLEKVVRRRRGTKAIAVYPRQKLAENQFDTFLGVLHAVNRELSDSPRLTLALDYAGTLYRRRDLMEAKRFSDKRWPVRGNTAIFPAASCPRCGGELGVAIGRYDQTPPLRCQSAACGVDVPEVRYIREDWQDEPADFYIAVTESLNNRMLNGDYTAIFGEGRLRDGSEPSLPGVLMLDEIHLHVANKGMQIGYLVRRLKRRLARAAEQRNAPFRLALVGLSATIAQGQSFFHKLTGVAEHRVVWVAPEEGETRRQGSEYFLFVKGNPDERTGVMSTLLQSAMALVHNMPQPADGRYLTLGFADSHDLIGRWGSQLNDAESNHLYRLRNVAVPASRSIAEQYFRQRPADCAQCHDLGHANASCIMFRKGECWWPMSGDASALNGRMRIATETSLRAANPEDYAKSDLIVATSRLEVGYDDDRIMAVIQYQAPGDAASFIQRKGRAGRQSGTYPITLAVLSPWSGRDAFYFKNPHLLTDPVFKELPLNPDNRLIQRIHGFYALFEHFIGKAAQEHIAPFSFASFKPELANDFRRWTGSSQDLDAVKAAVGASLDVSDQAAIETLAFEEGVLHTGLPRLLDRLAAETTPWANGATLLKDYLPPNFFSDINLPQLAVQLSSGPGSTRRKLEDFGLAQGLRTVLPGKVSWRGERPYWVPPDLQAGSEHRWYTLGDGWNVQAVPGGLSASAVPRRVADRLHLTGGQTVAVFRPDEVDVTTFAPGTWHLSNPAADGTVSVTRNRTKVPLDERSTAYGLSFDHIEFSGEHLPPQMDFVARTQAASAVFGPYGARLFERVRLADCRFAPMRIMRVVAGADLQLRSRRGNHQELYGFRRDGEACFLGYEMKTEGVAFTLPASIWATPLKEDALDAARDAMFQSRALSALEQAGHSGFTAAKLLRALVTTLDAFKPDDRPDALESGELDQALESTMRSVYRYRPDDVDEAMAIFRADDTRSNLGTLWRQAYAVLAHPTAKAIKDHMWDARVNSLAQALLAAAQEVAGVEVGQHLSVRAPLRIDDGALRQPTIHLFEEGIGGLGIARALHERFRSHPLSYWDAVEAKLRHCTVGDDEDLLLGLLRLEEVEVEAIARLAGDVWSCSSLHERREGIDALRRHARTALGLDLTPTMVKAVLRVFGPSLDEWDIELHNWRLVREIVVGVEDRFHHERGRHPNEYELTDAAMTLLRDDPTSLPTLSAFYSALQAMQPVDWDERLVSVRTVLDKDVARDLFTAIASEADLAELLDMEPAERQSVLGARYGLTRPEHIRMSDDEWLSGLDAHYFQADAELLWPESIWMVCHGREDEMAERFAFENCRSALRREIERRRLSSCRTACPSCLAGPAKRADHAMLDRRATHAAVVEARQDAELPVGANDAVTAIVDGITARFRTGAPRCYVTYPLAAQQAVSAAVAMLAMTGVRLDMGRHRLVVACSHLRALNLPTGAPIYEIGLELGDIQS